MYICITILSRRVKCPGSRKVFKTYPINAYQKYQNDDPLIVMENVTHKMFKNHLANEKQQA